MNAEQRQINHSVKIKSVSQSINQSIFSYFTTLEKESMAGCD